MRISTSQIFTSNVNNLSQANNDLFRTQQQLSTGKNVLQPSDDPLASAQIIKLKKEVARTDQFQGNIDVSRRRLELEEMTLDQLNNINIRLREITIQAGSTTLSGNDRSALASEVDEMTRQMLSLMNTKDVQGEYLFSGFQGEQQAYAINEQTQKYEFQGDSGQRMIQIGPDNRIASTDSGMKLFEQIEGLQQPFVSNNSDGVLTGVEITDLALFEEELGEEAVMPLSLRVDVDTVAGTINLIIEDSDDPATEFFNDDPANLETQLGLKVTLNADTISNDGTYEAAVDMRAEKTNPLNVAAELSKGLKELDLNDPQQKEEFKQLIAGSLDSLMQAEESNIQARTSLGARINALEQQEAVNGDYQLFTKETLSSFEDLDYSEAVSRFAMQQNVLQAAYQSFNQIRSLSLFNYL